MRVPTHNRTPEPSYASSPPDPTLTNYGMVVAAHQYATACGFFSLMATHVKVPIKTVDYSPIDKLSTLWVSILVGCRHTSDINVRLGTKEPALAALFGLTRFPDQSTVNRLLTALPEASLSAVRQMHFELLVRNTRARCRRLRTKLAKGHGRVLMVDLDQRGVVVSGTRYELAAAGHFGRKRGRRGYKLALAFIGGEIGEVLDEFFDPGSSPAGMRISEFLDTLERFCAALKLPHDRIVLRADALYGTPAILAQIQARGFGFLIKGVSPQRARTLARRCAAEAWVPSTRGADGHPRSVAELGLQQLDGQKPKDGPPAPSVRARVVLMQWQAPGRRTKARAGAAQRAREAARASLGPRTCYSMLVTSLSAEQMPVERVLDSYDDRATIERYFRDEDALGAHRVRTHRHTGAAVFEWMVAMTQNLLRWMKAKLFARTPIAGFGIGRLIGQVIAVTAHIERSGSRCRVLFSANNPLTKVLVAALTAPAQLLLPLRGGSS